MDGKRTLSENIADNGGLKVAYHAYKAWKEKNGDEAHLPGFEAYSSQKMFWISFASIYCTKYQPEYLKSKVLTDKHAPVEFRVIGPISNMPEFSEDFHCKSESNMNTLKKCSFW